MNHSLPSRGSDALPSPLPLVGRAVELARLEALLESEERDASIVFLRSEGGVGKSRLAAELAERATRRRWRVARGRAYPVETGVPYALFSDAWLPILRELDSSALQVLTRGGEAELRYLFPGLGGADLDLGAVGGEDPEEFRTRLMWNFSEFVNAYAARRQPVLCVLEDLQWADESSLQLVHFLARQSVGKPVLFLCTYNDQERDRSPQLVQTERSLASMRAAEVMHLQPLTVDQVTDLIRRTFGTDGDSVRQFAAVLFGWTRGNPFFAEEIVKSLVDSGALRREGGAWIGWDAKGFDMPGSIRDAVLQRMSRHSEEARNVLDLAAIVGTRATYALLASISGLESDELLAALEELCASRILDERSEGGDVVYRFAHPLVQQIVYDGFGLARASVLHGVVAEAMEAYYGSDAPERADELAFHFARAGGGERKAKATRYLAAAGRRALERRADVEAINYLQSALERTTEGGSDGDASRAELVPLLARAHTHVGQYAEAAGLWSAALERVPADQPAHFAIRRALGMAHFWCGRHEQAHLHFDAGLEAARAAGDQTATARLLVGKAHCLHEVGRGGEALATLEPALPIAEAVGDPGLLARVHRGLALVRVWTGPPEKAQEHAERAIDLASSVGDLSIEFWARWALAVLAGMRGDTDRMEVAIGRVNELASRARSPVLKLWTSDMTVELAFGRGDWDAGIAAGKEAINSARALNQRSLLPRILVWTSQFYVARGELDIAAGLLREAEEISGLDREEGPHNVHQVVPTYIGKAHYLVGAQDFDGAIAAAEKGLEIAEGTGYVLWAIHQLLPILAEACLWADRIDRAEEVGRRMRAHAERIDHRLGLAWADACDALVQWKRGDTEGSIPRMRSAAKELDAIPMIWYSTRLRRQIAARLREIGRYAEADHELREAWSVCNRLGAKEEMDRILADYRAFPSRSGIKPPRAPSADGALPVTPEELEVARLAARGLTNGQIAEARNSAMRTVSTHLSNIYGKLEIGGPGARMRLAELVRKAGYLD